MQLSHNTNQVLQSDSPQSTTQLLNQAHMMSHITCCESNLSIDTSCTRWCHPVASSSLACPLPSQLSCLSPWSLTSSLSSCLNCTRCTMYVCYMSSSQLICSRLVSDTTAHSLMQTSIHSGSCFLQSKKEIFTWIFACTIHSIMQWYYQYYASEDR